MLKAVLTDKATKPDTNPSCEDSAEIVNPVQSPACATETGPTVTRIHAATSRVTTNSRHIVPLVAITGCTVTQVHPITLIVTTTSVQAAQSSHTIQLQQAISDRPVQSDHTIQLQEAQVVESIHNQGNLCHKIKIMQLWSDRKFCFSILQTVVSCR